ncbi:MAG: hypothetical protein JRI94_03415 [Deltaproteobacteria bacterium]|nr:hypothetical protein [Deltaproteobacteria bacterium]MBW2032630.1 hypothetical protein [Deltaproteobacteria bacterium]
MTGIKSKIKKALKITGIAFGVIIILGIVSVAFVYKMENRSFPVKSLECKEGKLFGNWGRGEATSFQVRVTNKKSFGVKEIKIQINFYGKDKSPVDGTFITLHKNVPPRSTRLLHCNYLTIKGLPPEGEWTWTYSIINAKRTWIFD